MIRRGGQDILQPWVPAINLPKTEIPSIEVLLNASERHHMSFELENNVGKKEIHKNESNLNSQSLELQGIEFGDSKTPLSLDLGHVALQRIINQMKNLNGHLKPQLVMDTKCKHSGGIPPYCEYLRGNSNVS